MDERFKLQHKLQKVKCLGKIHRISLHGLEDKFTMQRKRMVVS
jgi:hypothetical protein